MFDASAPVILIDGSSYLFRAFYVPYLQALSTQDGHPTGAIMGVLNMIKSLQKQYPASRMIVVFDAKGKNFRHEMYADYKANRPPMPEELRCQIEPLHDIIRAMGLPLLIVDGVEADDVIGTLAHQATQTGCDAIISTGDKDMAQLVSPHVRLINTMTDTLQDEAGVVEKFGVKPNQIIDYLALMGDKVDNIPGVEKCGPKTAVKWLTEYGSLQGVMENADKIKGKIGENLRAALPQLPLSYELATIKLDVELPQALHEIVPTAADNEKLKALFTRYELKRHLKDLQASSDDSEQEVEVEQQADITTDYQTILTTAALNEWISKLEQADCFALDTETTGLDYMTVKLVGISICCEVGKAAYIPLGHDYDGAPKQLELDYVLAQLKPLLESTSIGKIGQNLKYDAHIFRRYGIELRNIAFDTMLESYCLNSTATRHNMDDLAKFYLNYQTVHFEDIAGKGAKQLSFNQIPLEKASHYAAEDADITLRLHQTLLPKLNKQPEQKRVLTEIEIPLAQVLTNMEHRGVLIDCDLLHQQSDDLAARIQELEIDAHNIAGKSFNLSSPKQLQQILFEELKIPVIKKTPKGAPSTAEEVLQELALDYPLPKVILEHRSLTKLKSTYTDKLPLMINRETGRVHTSYHQAVTATGRLSSTDPNLQNIPIRTAEGRKIRQAFIAPSEYKIVAIDYSQIELRIMAHLSDDKGLVTAFNQNQDIHRATAAEIFSVKVDDVSADQRRSAKAINFGLIYGMSAFGLAKQLGIGRNEAQKYMDAYFERYPGVLQYMEKTREIAHQQGYVETVFGRRLYLPELKSRNQARKKAAERAAINAPMQGTAADIIKIAMLKVDEWLSKQADQRQAMLMQVHDELIFEIHQDIVEQSTKALVEVMNNAVALAVPLIAEAGIGDNWQQAH